MLDGITGIKGANEGLSPKYKFVDKYLLRGPSPSMKDIFQLKKQGVTQVYDFRHKCFRGMKFLERIACKIAGIKYIRKPFSFLNDECPTLNDFEEVAKSVKQNGENGGKTLFHCNSGRHRTSHMATFYDITRGDGLYDYRKKHLFQYGAQVRTSILNQINNAGYFNRKKTHTSTYNPIKYFRNRFNNRVAEKTKEANNKFIDMLLGGYKVDINSKKM